MGKQNMKATCSKDLLEFKTFSSAGMEELEPL